ncbi:MAG TPA: hypothetical protein VGI79_00120 [Caulobacteraceae bacterium]
MAGSTIVLEFNELVPHLMDRFIAEGVLPGFERLRRESTVFKTLADEEPPALEPWIQWVTVHTGKSYGEHKVFELNDGPEFVCDRVWDLVSDTGENVWVCGSMNSAVRGGSIKGMVLPDPWAVGVTPQPAGAFDDYFRFVSTYVKEYSAEKVPLSLGDHLKFGAFMLTHGLSVGTMVAAVKQLATERKRNRKWARAFILDRMQFDLFRHFHRKLKPKFSTLFLNSTAHFQHFYWRNMDPDLFEIKPSAKDQAVYHDAIRSGYIQMDALVRSVLDMAGKDTSVVFATALSQQPLVKYDRDGGKLLFRPHDGDLVNSLAGITAPYRVEPVMSGGYSLAFNAEAEAVDAAERLNSLTVTGGEALLVARLMGSKISVVCNIHQALDDDAMVLSPHSNEVLSFNALFYPIHGITKSGWHHPEGMLWVRTPARRHATVDRVVSLQEIAPTLLQLCGVPAPEGAFAFSPIAELQSA